MKPPTPNRDYVAAAERIRLASLFGLPSRWDGKFQVDGRKYRAANVDLDALTFLAKLAKSRPSPPNVYWLLPFRKQLRKLNAGIVYAFAAQQTRHSAVRCLAVWLRGRRGGTIGTRTIASLYDSDDPAQRKEVVRALKRMHAWAALRRIEATEPEERIRRLAKQKPPRDYRNRMSQFLQQVEPSQIGPLGTSLYENAEIELGGGVPPRNPSLIREILERIRFLVRGKAKAPGKVCQES